ncbi:MAG: ferrochelatase [Acidobacteriales bacterium]|nr:ferrochelatase [Terriglobales bacterium]
MPDTAVLLLAHGTPDSPDEVPEYMRLVTSGRNVPEAVIEEVKRRYGLIGRSPLTDISLAQGKALQDLLGVPVYVGMRNWRPYITDTVKRMIADGVKRVVAICLAPQNSRTSVGLYKRATLAAAGESLAIDFVDEWHDEPLLAKAFAAKLTAPWKQACARSGARVPVLFTAHSVPCRTIQASASGAGDPYGNQCKETAAEVAKLAGLVPGEWFFAFQSQGMSGGPWIGPTVEDTITGLCDAGATSVFVQPIGFVCDHVEVLYDIDIAFKQFAKERGMQLWRAASLNDSAGFIAALAAVARRRMERA